MDVTRAIKELEGADEAAAATAGTATAAAAAASSPTAAASAAAADTKAAAAASDEAFSEAETASKSLPQLHADGTTGDESSSATAAAASHSVEPAVHASRGPHAALAAEPTADIAPHAEDNATAVRGSGSGSKQGIKVAKGFFGAAPKPKKPSSAAGSGQLDSSTSSSSSSRAAGSRQAADDGAAEEIDCAALQSAAAAPSITVNGVSLGAGDAAKGAAAAGGGGSSTSGRGAADVTRMLHHSNTINLAVSQVRRRFESGFGRWAGRGWGQRWWKDCRWPSIHVSPKQALYIKPDTNHRSTQASSKRRASCSTAS